MGNVKEVNGEGSGMGKHKGKKKNYSTGKTKAKSKGFKDKGKCVGKGKGNGKSKGKGKGKVEERSTFTPYPDVTCQEVNPTLTPNPTAIYREIGLSNSYIKTTWTPSYRVNARVRDRI